MASQTDRKLPGPGPLLRSIKYPSQATTDAYNKYRDNTDLSQALKLEELYRESWKDDLVTQGYMCGICRYGYINRVGNRRCSYEKCDGKIPSDLE